MNKYKKSNNDWEVKLNNVLLNKENNYDSKMNENIEKLEKKHSKDKKVNTEANLSKISDNVFNRLERINSKIESKKSVFIKYNIFFIFFYTYNYKFEFNSFFISKFSLK